MEEQLRMQFRRAFELESGMANSAAAGAGLAARHHCRAIYEKFVRPAMLDRRKVAAHCALMSLFEPSPEEAKVYCYKVQIENSDRIEAGRAKLAIGSARVISEISQESEVFTFGALHIS